MRLELGQHQTTCTDMKRSQEPVDGAMHVMERKDMQDDVSWGPGPGRHHVEDHGLEVPVGVNHALRTENYGAGMIFTSETMLAPREKSPLPEAQRRFVRCRTLQGRCYGWLGTE